MNAHKPPRGLVLATGDQSLRARMLIVEVAPGDVDLTVLSDCQQSAAAGLFSQAMASFISWVAEQYHAIQERLRARVVELRAAGRGAAMPALQE